MKMYVIHEGDTDKWKLLGIAGEEDIFPNIVSLTEKDVERYKKIENRRIYEVNLDFDNKVEIK